MDITQNPNNQENQNQTQNFFPISMSGPLGMPKNPISSLSSLNPQFKQDEQTKNNIFYQKRNRMEDSNKENTNKLENNFGQESKSLENKDINNDINIKSLINPKNKLNQSNQFNSHEQFICKKMSLDLEDDDINNQNLGNKKIIGCNCKNSGCLKRYCECFSRMKYCDNNCQCKNCLNNINYEKKRNEAIRIYLIKSPISFKKINLDLKNVICNCKKSNCLKNYCECFQFGLKCTYNCGCVDCKNRNLFEKKLFFVENKCDLKNNNKQNNNITNDKSKININNQNDNNLKRKEEDDINKLNNADNYKINISNNFVNEINIKKNINNPQFIVNKNVNEFIGGNITRLDIKNRNRFLSFDDDISQISQWNNLNLKKIEISNKKVIIDNYNITQPENIVNSSQNNLFNNYTNYFYNNITNTNNNNNVIITRKNSAFSAIIK